MGYRTAAFANAIVIESTLTLPTKEARMIRFMQIASRCAAVLIAVITAEAMPPFGY